ncbi:carbon-nitrogen hydrolase family protein [Rhodocaloribacter litoris]|uniref:carbon-nitrogen hydrolase family protein n=1 Tax=Rhodocaloribacter litoris TaxID=2558931 RepID=UPI001421B4CE|nr:carbon-nitrogen hydrolase family protein [Rhodocaloribacter litoris]QXD15068.1 carbon-nitrogen hydrolase family protein [Rhodocaloribacter litoris]GIV62138.1 MAG: nitrilase [Rhodothermaceae bacterium]
MIRQRTPFRVAAVQAAPVFLDRDATVARACDLIAEAARAGARLVVFPECFIPTYPFWVWFIPPYRTADLRALYAELLDNAVVVPGPVTERLGEAAREAGVHVVMGINEINVETSGTTLYNTLLFIDDTGRLLGKHRKLIPTAAERLVHGMGDGSTLGVYETPFGRLGGLICWEMYMPLARYALYGWGTEILVAPTWDRGEPWISTLRHTAKEGRVYVVGCCTAMHRNAIPDRYAFKQDFLPDVTWINPGDSAIVDPDGKFVVEPVRECETILYADLEPSRVTGPRFQLDVAGHYARPDIFELKIHCTPRPVLHVVDPKQEPPAKAVPTPVTPAEANGV